MVNVDTSPIVSFIIPAYNESELIANTLKSIHTYAAALDHEVIVVDNGSTDDTADIATSCGATVLNFPIGTISAVRNAGVAISRGQTLVFLDADVTLTAQWGANIVNEIEELEENSNRVFGSRCATPDKNSFVGRYWFERLHIIDSSYINSGHMITSRVLFDRLGGFDESRKTGEDHDICIRAAQAGATIGNIDNLRVVHHDYPTNFITFFKREKWHGLNDVKNFSSFLESTVAIVAFMLFMTIAVGIATSLYFGKMLPIAIALALVVIVLYATVIKKFGAGSVKKTSGTAVVLGVYFAARLSSLFSLGKSGQVAHDIDQES